MICGQLHNVNLHARKDVVEAFKKEKLEGKTNCLGQNVPQSQYPNTPPIITLILANGNETHAYLHTAVSCNRNR